MQPYRYRIADDVSRLRLFNREAGTSEAVYFQHDKPSPGDNLPPRWYYWVNILERDGSSALMEIHNPEGSPWIGWQDVCWLTLHRLGDPFDGRYNAAVEART